MDLRRSETPQGINQNNPQEGGVLVSENQPSQTEQTSGASTNSNNPPLPPQNSNPPLVSVDEEKSVLPLLVKLAVGFIILILISIILLIFLHSKSNIGLNSQKTVTLQWWGLWEDPGVMQTLISDFERSHPDIKVQYIKQDPNQYSQRLLTRILNGSGPDIFRYHASWIPMVQPFLSPLSSNVISKQDFSKDYYPVVQQDLVKNGAIYGIPLEIDSLSLFTNNQLLQTAGFKPPVNWTDFITIARALTVKDQTGKIQTSGASLGTFDNITHAPDVVSLLLLQNGANIFDLGKTKQNASDALVFYTSFAQNDGSVWDNNLDPSINMFANGKLAMMFGYSYDVFNIKSLNPNLSFSVNPVPHLLGRNFTVASYWVEGVSNRSQHQKEAMTFMNFLSQKETEQKLYSEEAKTRLFGEPYARTDLGNSLKNDPLVYPFVSQATNSQSSFFAGETYDTGLNAQMNGYLGNAVRSVLSNSSPQSSVDTLSQGVAQILNQYAPKTQ